MPRLTFGTNIFLVFFEKIAMLIPKSILGDMIS
jgi:hypothetical protein